MAFTGGHVHAISETQMRHMTVDFVPTYFPPSCAKRLVLVNTEYIRDRGFDEAKRLFPQMSDTQVMRFVQGTCHEIRFFLEVVPNV